MPPLFTFTFSTRFINFLFFLSVLPLRCSTPSSFNKISSAPSSPTKRSSTTGRKSSTSSSTRSSIIDSATSPRSLDFWDQQLEGVELSWKRASEGSTIASTSNSLAVVEGSPRPRSQSLGEMKPSSSSTSKSIKPKLKAPAETLPNLGSIWESFLIEAEVSFEEADDLLSVPIPIPQALNSSISSSNRSISPFGLTSTTNVLDPFNQPTMFPIPTSSRNSLAERRDQSVSPLVISKTRSRTPSPTSISNTTRTKYESTPSTQPQLSDPISPSFPFLHHLSNTPNEFPSSSADNLNTYSPTTFTKLSLDSSYPPSSHSNSFNLRALTPSSGSSSSESSSSSNKSSPNHSPTNSLPSPLSPPPSAIFDSTPSSSTSSFSYSEFNFKGIYSPNSVSTIAEEEGYETDASSVHSVSRSEDRKSSNWGEEFERLGAGSRGSWFEPATSPPRPHSEASSNTDGSSYASLSGDGYGEEEDNDDTIRIAVVKQVSEIIESLKIQGQGVHFDLEVRDYKMERRIEEVEVGIIEWGVAL